MSMQNKQFDNENNVKTNTKIALKSKQEEYELNVIISPIFGLNQQTTIISSKNNSNLKQKNEENIFHKKEVEYNNSYINKSTNIGQIQKNKEQQPIYDPLPSRNLEFHEKISTKNNSLEKYTANNDTIITTIDLLIDDILDEK